jgi:predicted ABC-type ATPase
MGGRPQVIVLGGPNGAGKSTAANLLVPGEFPYVNADEIAKTLDGYPSREADFAASRIVLTQLDELGRTRGDFAVESTLAGASLAVRIGRLRDVGYLFRLIFLWTPNAEFSIQRVASRVRAGGHNIPEAVVRRRHAAGITNFFSRYRPIADKWEVYNSTSTVPTLVAEGRLEEVDLVEDAEIWIRMRGVVGDG